jgi:hypothetical protein
MAEAEIQTTPNVRSQEKIYRKITPVLNKGHNDFDGFGIWFFCRPSLFGFPCNRKRNGDQAYQGYILF